MAPTDSTALQQACQSGSDRPMRVTVIAWLFIVNGVFALADVLYDLSEQRVNLNFGVLLVPEGIGLLYGTPKSQWWARVWIILGYVLCIGMLVFTFLDPSKLVFRVFHFKKQGPEVAVYAQIFCAVSILTLFLIHRLLFSPKANAYFNRHLTSVSN